MARFTRPQNHKYMGEGRGQLPAGGYVLKIYDIKTKKWPSGDEYFEVSFDIAEGEYKDYFKNDYTAQTGDNKWWRGVYNLNPFKDGDPEWKINKFWDFFYAVEDSNPGFKFSGDTSDINKANFSNKILGATFRREESKSKNSDQTFWNTRLFNCKPADDIRKGNFNTPKDKPISCSSGSGSDADYNPATGTGFINIPEGTETELPF